MGERLSPLASPTATRDVLEAHGLATKKALGQNFLISDNVIRHICELSGVQAEDDVLEVGPGIGTLTTALLQKASRVVSVERDRDLPAVLAETCAPWADRFTLISKDALQLQKDDLPFSPDLFIANLPYAVAATLVLDYFERFDSLRSATVMVQSEVADRMAAQPGTKNYGAYTVKLRLFAEPMGRFKVSPGNFYPPPRVDSAVLRLDRTEADALTPAQRSASAFMADAAFANRRKTISNSCKMFFNGRADGLELIERLPQAFSVAGIDPSVRGESLDLDAFKRLGCAWEGLAG